MRLARLENEFAAAARPEDQGDRLNDEAGNLLFDRDGVGDDRPEIDRRFYVRFCSIPLSRGQCGGEVKLRRSRPV
jgi:hypothetical protein